ncbi:MAG: hypothetical protein ACTIMJ_06120 [Weissella hellenica]|uniref:hypothetical protein n=1 Tax=Weissella hellenica TaxID=46256 RepID=UPI003F99688C
MKIRNILQSLVVIILIIAAIYSLLPERQQPRAQLTLDSGKIVYHGDVFKEKFNGLGTIKFKNKDQYRGHFIDGKFEGQGKFISHESWQYQGTFKNNLPDGKGVLTIDKHKYRVTFKKGELIDAN